MVANDVERLNAIERSRTEKQAGDGRGWWWKGSGERVATDNDECGRGSIEGECAGKERQVRARVTRQYPAIKWAKEDITETESKPGSSCIQSRLEALLFRSASS